MNKKYKILCLSTGDCVKLQNVDIFAFCELSVKEAANYDQIVKNMNTKGRWAPTLLTFANYDAAHWFVRRRLSFNPRRTASRKVEVMNKVFELNGINPLSNKVEFDIMEVTSEDEQ